MASHTRLEDKLDDLLTECIVKNVYPDLSARIKKYAAACSKGADLMLKKGRRLTEQTLDSCQMKRTRAVDVEAELKHVAAHLVQWKVLGLEISFGDFAAMALYAKHRCGTSCARRHDQLGGRCAHCRRRQVARLDVSLRGILTQGLACRGHELEGFQLLRQPLVVTYDEFETLLLLMAFDLFEHKKRSGPSFEESLGTFMDRIFRTSGVLVDYPQE